MLLGEIGGSLCLSDWISLVDMPQALQALRGRLGFSTYAFERTPILEACRQQLEGYFRAEVRHFDLPTRLYGTPFEVSVWEALRELPYGQVLSYEAFTKRIASPETIRAVAGAIGRNPLGIIIPCHRVVACNGLGGFSAGAEVKRFLLALEQGLCFDVLDL